jgi:hypothetical protein
MYFLRCYHALAVAVGAKRLQNYVCVCLSSIPYFTFNSTRPEACYLEKMKQQSKWNLKIILKLNLHKKLNSVAFSPQANYTDRATAACRRS